MSVWGRSALLCWDTAAILQRDPEDQLDADGLKIACFVCAAQLQPHTVLHTFFSLCITQTLRTALSHMHTFSNLCIAQTLRDGHQP